MSFTFVHYWDWYVVTLFWLMTVRRKAKVLRAKRDKRQIKINRPNMYQRRTEIYFFLPKTLHNPFSFKGVCFHNAITAVCLLSWKHGNSSLGWHNCSMPIAAGSHFSNGCHYNQNDNLQWPNTHISFKCINLCVYHIWCLYHKMNNRLSMPSYYESLHNVSTNRVTMFLLLMQF